MAAMKGYHDIFIWIAFPYLGAFPNMKIHAEHWAYKHQSRERFIAWATHIGPHTKAQVEAIFERKAHDEQAFRTLKGVQRLANQYGCERLEAACQRANRFKMTGLRRLKAILTSHLDGVPLPSDSVETPIAHHDNVRGQTYYQ